jgi:hypothetical protein
MRFLTALGILLIALVAFIFWTKPRHVSNRTNILVGSSPVSIWSWDRTNDSFVVVELPADVAIDSPAYGRYSLESLWKLGFIDKKGGSPLVRSIHDALALPLHLYIGETGQELAHVKDVQSYGKQMFTLGGWASFLLGRRQTNIPLGTYLAMSWNLMRARPDAIHIVDFTTGNIPVGQETLPDATVRKFFDIERIDVILKGRFEDEEIRNEQITVAVYNTTSTPALGTYAARLITTEGVLVVAVGNQEPAIADCEVHGGGDLIESKTARVIAELLECKILEKETQGRADLEVFLGSTYAKQVTSGN